MKLHIEQRYVKALLLCAGKNDIRYYSNGVLFRVKGNQLTAVAIDGHRMLIVQQTLDPESYGVEDGEHVIPREALEQAVKFVTPKSLPPVICIDVIEGELRTVTCKNLNGQSLLTQAVDDKFPDWDRVVPKDFSNRPASFKADSLADFAKIAKLVSCNANTALRILTNGEASARVHFLGAIDVFGVLMPCHDDTEYALPGAVVPTPEPAPELETTPA